MKSFVRIQAAVWRSLKPPLMEHLFEGQEGHQLSHELNDLREDITK